MEENNVAQRVFDAGTSGRRHKDSLMQSSISVLQKVIIEKINLILCVANSRRLVQIQGIWQAVLCSLSYRLSVCRNTFSLAPNDKIIFTIWPFQRIHGRPLSRRPLIAASQIRLQANAYAEY